MYVAVQKLKYYVEIIISCMYAKLVRYKHAKNFINRLATSAKLAVC